MILLFAIILALIAPWIIDIWMLGEIKPDKSLIWMMVLLYLFLLGTMFLHTIKMLLTI